MAKKTSLNKGLESLLGDVAESKNSEKPQKNVKKEMVQNKKKNRIFFNTKKKLRRNISHADYKFIRKFRIN